MFANTYRHLRLLTVAYVCLRANTKKLIKRFRGVCYSLEMQSLHRFLLLNTKLDFFIVACSNYLN